MAKSEKNVINPGVFGHGTIGAEAVAEERARVEQLERLLGPAGVAAVGLAYAQELYDAIVEKEGHLPEFKWPR